MSKLNYKDPAESALVNSAFLGRSVDDATTGKLDLSNVESVSGDAIVNLQRQVNANKNNLLSDQSVASNGVFLYDTISKTQVKRIVGIGSINANAIPFGSTPDLQDGTIFYILGKDDANTVTITHNDADDGCLLNGDAELKKGYCLQLLWNASIKRFIDIGRNF